MSNSRIISWFWDFGDAKNKSKNTSDDKNPVHYYAASGTYYVKLTVTAASGCQAYKIDTVQLEENAIPDFKSASPACSGKAIYFTDAGKTAGFIPVKWQWYFGDGDTIATDHQTPVCHRYDTAGTYRLKLFLVNKYGCTSDTLTKPITINPTPVPDFEVPKVCVMDEYAAFTDLSMMPDQSKPAFAYSWNFGDEYATSSDPNVSNVQNPKHKYRFAKTYTVSLTITSPQGCDTTIKKTITVNGVEPQAGFDILNDQAAICSGQPVILKNQSKVLDFGSITKLEWYFDALNKPVDKEVIDTPRFNEVYTHNYKPLNNTVSYTIKLIAYSGNVCVDSISKKITVLPLPRLQFDSLPTVCLQTAPFQITQAKETSGVAGDGGKYYGDGITTGGIFNPLIAGVGPHVVKFKFTSVSNCADSVSRLINVVNAPVLTAPNTVYVLQGQSTKLTPAYGPGILKYKWAPAEGLNSDTAANPVVTPKDSLTYTITASNGGCEVSGKIHVTVLKPLVIYNTFTPNGDQVNDFWHIPNLNDYPGATVSIFNRYGERLYYSVGYANPWDGKYKGAYVPAGTYYYIINPQNGQKVYSGYIVVLR